MHTQPRTARWTSFPEAVACSSVSMCWGVRGECREHTGGEEVNIRTLLWTATNEWFYRDIGYSIALAGRIVHIVPLFYGLWSQC